MTVWFLVATNKRIALADFFLYQCFLSRDIRFTFDKLVFSKKFKKRRQALFPVSKNILLFSRHIVPSIGLGGGGGVGELSLNRLLNVNKIKKKLICLESNTCVGNKCETET